ncbi:hypothetical protein BBP40_006418 [Aspergillus hancockii]|nr:hypothetical protein BBP40_006418 [Aspergillus hancockii]
MSALSAQTNNTNTHDQTIYNDTCESIMLTKTKMTQRSDRFFLRGQKAAREGGAVEPTHNQ